MCAVARRVFLAGATALVKGEVRGEDLLEVEIPGCRELLQVLGVRTSGKKYPRAHSGSSIAHKLQSKRRDQDAQIWQNTYFYELPNATFNLRSHCLPLLPSLFRRVQRVSLARTQDELEVVSELLQQRARVQRDELLA